MRVIDPFNQSSWSVIADGANHVLTQSAVSPMGAQVAGGNVTWTDQMVEARVKLLTAPAQVQVAARFVDGRDYYFVELSDSGAVKLRKRSVGVTTDLFAAPATTPLVVGTWYTVRLEVQGSMLTAYLNGVAVASGLDATLPIAAGGVALSTSSNGVVFDDVRVTVP